MFSAPAAKLYVIIYVQTSIVSEQLVDSSLWRGTFLIVIGTLLEHSFLFILVRKYFNFIPNNAISFQIILFSFQKILSRSCFLRLFSNDDFKICCVKTIVFFVLLSFFQICIFYVFFSVCFCFLFFICLMWCLFFSIFKYVFLIFFLFFLCFFSGWDEYFVSCLIQGHTNIPLATVTSSTFFLVEIFLSQSKHEPDQGCLVHTCSKNASIFSIPSPGNPEGFVPIRRPLAISTTTLRFLMSWHVFGRARLWFFEAASIWVKFPKVNRGVHSKPGALKKPWPGPFGDERNSLHACACFCLFFFSWFFLNFYFDCLLIFSVFVFFWISFFISSFPFKLFRFFEYAIFLFFCGICSVFSCFFACFLFLEFVLECVDCFFQLFFLIFFWIFENFSDFFRFFFARIATFRSSPF